MTQTTTGREPIRTLADGWHPLDRDGAALLISHGRLHKLRSGPRGTDRVGDRERHERHQAVLELARAYVGSAQVHTGPWCLDDGEAFVHHKFGSLPSAGARPFYVPVVEARGRRWAVLEGSWAAESSEIPAVLLIDEHGTMIAGNLTPEQIMALEEVGELESFEAEWVTHPTIPPGTPVRFWILAPKRRA
jgi:hypothetical protein